MSTIYMQLYVKSQEKKVVEIINTNGCRRVLGSIKEEFEMIVDQIFGKRIGPRTLQHRLIITITTL